jgi:hypothetical protein
MAALAQLISDADQVRKFRHAVRLTVVGYEDDPADLWGIPEVRCFVADLDRAFPYLLWFLAPESGSLLLLASCCCSTSLSVARGGKTAVVFPPEWLGDFLRRHVESIEELALRFHLRESDIEPVLKGSARSFSSIG